MTEKKPFRYTLSPKAVDRGRSWLRMALENVGMDTLSDLHVRLNSLDDYGVEVITEDAFVPLLDPEAKHVVPMQIVAKASGSVYVTVDGDQDGEPFHWESPDITITVGEEAASLVSLLASVERGVVGDRMIRCEATLEGKLDSDGLDLEFWVETPEGAFEELAIVETKALSPGEKAHYVAEMEPEEDGRYTLYAYLYDGATRIGRVMETVRVGEG